MVKTIISIVVVACLVITGAIFEATVINKQFDEFATELNSLYQLTETETPTEEDVYALQENWRSKKNFLHAFISHNEIREFDLWIADMITFVREKEWTDAMSKLEVLISLTHEAPRSFIMNFASVF